jgi:hypothetical protein
VSDFDYNGWQSLVNSCLPPDLDARPNLYLDPGMTSARKALMAQGLSFSPHDQPASILQLLLGQETARNRLGKTKWDRVPNRDRLVGRNHYGGQQSIVRHPKARARLIGDDQRVLGRDSYRAVPGLTGIGIRRIAAGNRGSGKVGPILAQEVRRDIRAHRTAVEDVDIRTIGIAVIA